MCKMGTKLVAVNRVMLGARIIGIECWSIDRAEVVGLTEKQLKDVIADGVKVYGYELSEDGKELVMADGFNMMNKIGIATFEAMKETDTMLNDMFSLIGHDGKGEYVFITPRFGKKILDESKLRALLEIASGSINGVELVDGKLVTWFKNEGAEEVVNTTENAHKKK